MSTSLNTLGYRYDSETVIVICPSRQPGRGLVLAPVEGARDLGAGRPHPMFARLSACGGNGDRPRNPRGHLNGGF
jgi:hypothetical protein